MPRLENCLNLLRIIEKKQKNMINTLLARTKKKMFPFHQSRSREKNKSIDNWKTTTRIGLVVLAKLIFITNNKRFPEVSENELVKGENKFLTTSTLKIKKRGAYRKFPFLCNKMRTTQLSFFFNRSSTFRILEAYYGLLPINVLLEVGHLLKKSLKMGGAFKRVGHLFEALW